MYDGGKGAIQFGTFFFLPHHHTMWSIEFGLIEQLSNSMEIALREAIPRRFATCLRRKA